MMAVRQRPRVAITNRVHPDVIAYLQSVAEVTANTRDVPWSRDQTIQHARDAFGLLAFMPDCVDEDLLNACPALRVIACALKGHDNFDITACTRCGVWLTVVPDLLTEPTAELAVGLMIALCRNLIEGDRRIRRGDFRGWRPVLYGGGLSGATVGILGMGAIGQAIARRLRGFDCRILYFDRRALETQMDAGLGAAASDFETVLRDSDFLVLALPLSAETEHIIDSHALSLVKPGCRLINPARGSLVDEEAVADAIATERLAGYAADVFAFEDQAATAPPSQISPRLVADLESTVMTPHLGSAVEDTRREIDMEAARNIVDCLEGRRPRGAVNRITMAL